MVNLFENHENHVVFVIFVLESDFKIL